MSPIEEKTATVRDTRNAGHFWADNEVLIKYGRKLGPYGLSVYMVFSLVSRNGTGECRLTLRQIEAMTGISIAQASRAIQTLMECGLVRRDYTSKSPKDGPSIYSLLSVHKMSPEEINQFWKNTMAVSVGKWAVPTGNGSVPPRVDTVSTGNTVLDSNNTSNKTNTSSADQKTSAGGDAAPKKKKSKAQDERHTPFKEIWFKHYRLKNPHDQGPPPWSGTDAAMLSRILKGHAPDTLNAIRWERQVKNYFDSKNINPPDPAYVRFLKRPRSYDACALDEFGKPTRAAPATERRDFTSASQRMMEGLK